MHSINMLPRRCQEVVSIPIIGEDARALYPPKDNMMKGTECIKARHAGYGGRIA
jgi:hypothetical protein